jgi:DNA-binding response OmpR family regulator
MFVTAHRSSTYVKEAKESGGVAYLEKPFRSSSLLWMVKSLLAKIAAGEAP